MSVEAAPDFVSLNPGYGCGLVLIPFVCKLSAAGGRAVGKDSRDLIREIEADGWRFVGATGSHHHFKHPYKPGKVTIPHPRRDLHPKTIRSIYRQAGLKETR
jgi:predicted RNA binding protein YcfA (HicA-like mRNA interferase family)